MIFFHSFICSVVRCFLSSFIRSVGRWVIPSFDSSVSSRPLVHPLVCSFAMSVFLSFALSLPPSIACSFVRSLVRSPVRYPFRCLFIYHYFLTNVPYFLGLQRSLTRPQNHHTWGNLKTMQEDPIWKSTWRQGKDHENTEKFLMNRKVSRDKILKSQVTFIIS